MFVETPLLSYPVFTFPSSLIKKSVCAYCCKFLRSLEYQLNLFLAATDEVESLPNIDVQESYLSDLEPCSMACGELYCSQKCRDLDWDHSHKILCPKVAPGWQAFYTHAVDTGNYVNFVMGAKFCAHIITSEKTEERVRLSVESFLRYFHFREWKETILVTIAGAEPEQELEALNSEFSTSFDLLKKLFVPFSQDPVYAPLFNPEAYSKILGAFNLNNIAVEIESPLSQYVLQIQNLPRKFRNKAVNDLAPLIAKAVARKQLFAQSNGSMESDEEDFVDEEILEWKFRKTAAANLESVSFSSKLFPDYEGSGLFPLVSKFNHSCAPNVTMEFADSNTVFALASRDIRAGEEMTISYVDLRLDLEDRKRELHEYFFDCRCGVCEIEQRQIEDPTYTPPQGNSNVNDRSNGNYNNDSNDVNDYNSNSSNDNNSADDDSNGSNNGGESNEMEND